MAGEIKETALMVKTWFDAPAVRGRFEEVLGKKSNGFISSVVSAVKMNPGLRECPPESVVASALVLAILDLPVVQSLGFAAIVPFRDKSGKKIAQPQIMWKGFGQLFLRSGQAARQNATAIYDGQLKKWDPVTGDFEYDLAAKKSDKVIGYVSYFRLTNGYEHYLYMTIEEIEKHAKRYSASYKSGYGIWFDNPEPMRLKTPHKLNLMKWAPMTNDMQLALTIDQGIIKNPSAYTEGAEEIEINYPDGTTEEFEQPKQPETGTLDISKMQAGDPATHQGHPEPMRKAEVVMQNGTSINAESAEPPMRGNHPEMVRYPEGEMIPPADIVDEPPEETAVVTAEKREELTATLQYLYENGKVGTKGRKDTLAKIEAAKTQDDIDNIQKALDSAKKAK